MKKEWTALDRRKQTIGDSEFDHLWGGRSGEGSMMLQDPKLPNDPED